MTAADAILAALAAPVLGASGYLALLSLFSRRETPPSASAPHLRFDIVVPAHDEARGIAATIASLRALDYPSELYRVVVVADNCTDDTASIARAKGAIVRVRDDPSHRGKGYALAHAFEHILSDGRVSAVAVVDADTTVSTNLLRAFAARIEAGASAIQADYAIRNAASSWRTRLMAVAFAMVHTLRSRARERLGVSCGLRGNGMCFTTSLLAAVPHDAFSLVEDLEYGIRLGVAGHRVHYAGEARVHGDMPAGERGSRAQRRRWEDGRAQMRRAYAARLLLRGLLRRDRISLDLAMDLLIPPLSTIVAVTAVGLAASAALSWQAGHVLSGARLWIVAAMGLGVYGLRGWQLSGTGARGLADLVFVPTYIVWKLALRLRSSARANGEWVRTAREGEEAP